MLRRLLCILMLLWLAATGRAQENDPKPRQGGPPLDGLKALKHPDARVRYRAAQTLGQLGPLAKFAAPELRELLKDQNGVVRVKAVESLWKIEKTSPSLLTPILLAALKDRDPLTRAAAPPVLALFGTKAKVALPLLVDALADSDFDVKLAAVNALGDLGPMAKGTVDALLDMASQNEFVLLEPFVGAALSNLGESVVPTLSRALSSQSAARRRVAAYALDTLGPVAASATEALTLALKSDDAAGRKQAASALGKIGKNATAAMPALRVALNDPDPFVRIEAALAGWHISGKPSTVSTLVKALQEDNPNVRDSAAQALGTMKAGADEAVEPLINLLSDKDLRIRAIITLGEIGPRADRAIDGLQMLRKDLDQETQLLAAFALWRIDGRADDARVVLEKGLQSQTQDHLAIRLLGEMGPAAQDAVPILADLYRAEEVLSYRQLLASAIKKIDPAVATKLGIR